MQPLDLVVTTDWTTKEGVFGATIDSSPLTHAFVIVDPVSNVIFEKASKFPQDKPMLKSFFDAVVTYLGTDTRKYQFVEKDGFTVPGKLLSGQLSGPHNAPEARCAPGSVRRYDEELRYALEKGGKTPESVCEVFRCSVRAEFSN